MSSMKCGSTQQDVDQQPTFRVKLRLKLVWLEWKPGRFGWLRAEDVYAGAFLSPNGPHVTALRRLGLEP